MINRLVLFLVAIIMIAVPTGVPAQMSGSDAIEMTAEGMINWTAGEIYAKGIGAPPDRPLNAAQARAMAERAAFVVALRNLLETVKGVRIDSESVVENFMVKSDVIRTRVDGIVKGARIVKTQYMSDGSVEVLVSLPMKGSFMNAVVPDNFGATTPTPVPQGYPLVPEKPRVVKPVQPADPAISPSLPEKKAEPSKPSPAQSDQKIEPVKPQQPQPSVPPRSNSTVTFKGGVATGLVIDARGLGLRPALLPKVVDQQGQEVYVGLVVTRTNAVEQGVAGYAKDVNAASNNFRVTDNPAVIKGLSAGGAARTDVVIGQADALALRQLSSKGDFLQYCRVIIVY